MKKLNLLVLLFALLTCSAPSFAKSVSVNTAKTVGYNYLSHQGGASLNSESDLSLAYTSGGANPFFYVFSGDHCFVIVCAEDGVTPVLGYSTDRTFHGDKIPWTVTGFFENYNKQIDYVINNHVEASPEIAADWQKLINNESASHSGARTTVVAPLLHSTWDQYPYYNALCPADAGASSTGGHDVTGCVATATAQVMKFWSWPTTGVGTHSYATSAYGTLSANFGATTYNWAAMPNNVTSSNPSVATLMYHVGVSVNMDYTPSESGAYVISSATGTAPYCAEYSLKTFFNYDPTLHGYARAAYSDATWISMLKADLDLGHPIIYAGTGTSGGHCFVFDGYNATSMFHVNWGWSGSGPDGYYTIDALNPPALGAGGGGGGFNSDQDAILGVKPNGGGGGGGGGTTDSLEVYDYVYSYTPSVFYTDSFSIITNIANYSSTVDFSGDFGALAFDAGGTFVGVIDSFIGASLPAFSAYTSDLVFHTSGMVSMIPGTYNVGIYYRHPGGAWVALDDNPPYYNSTTITVYNSNFIELNTAMTPVPSPMVQGSAASVSLKIYNADGSTTWSDSLYLGLYNLDGSYNSDIKALGVTTVGALGTSATLNFSTSSITATPGTYLLVLWFKYLGNWYICGADYHENPQYVTVVAPAPVADIYEVNNTAVTAHDLSSLVTWSAGSATVKTTGSNFHIVTDQDYYKIVYPAGYNYTITPRVNDLISTDDGLPYTIDAVWSYSTDGGLTWSAVYNNTMTGSINVPSTGGTVIFHCSPHYSGTTGTYILKISNTRATPTNLPEVNLSQARIYPNPASDFINVDLSGTGTHAQLASIVDVQGKKVYSSEINSESQFAIPVNTLSPGMYFIQVATDGGPIVQKITIGK